MGVGKSRGGNLLVQDFPAGGPGAVTDDQSGVEQDWCLTGAYLGSLYTVRCPVMCQLRFELFTLGWLPPPGAW